MYNLVRINENTWAYEDEIHDGDTVRFFVLDGEEKCLVIDSGFQHIDVHGIVKELLKMEEHLYTSEGSEKEIILANTHGDGDHTGGNYSFSYYYISDEDYNSRDLKNLCPDSDHIPAEEGLEIELGGRTLRYIMTPGHTKGNAALLDITNRVLYSGDMVQTGSIFEFGPHRCPDRLADSLVKLKSMKDMYDQVYACHGRMILPPDAVDETLRSWNMVLNREVVPVGIEMFGNKIDLYNCGFCSFLCDPGFPG